MRTVWTAVLGAALALAATSPALAWGSMGHKVAARIAYDNLHKNAKAAVDALLRRSADSLTPSDFVSVSVWADRDRYLERSTGPWHFASFPLRGATNYDTCPVVASPKQDVAPSASNCIVAKLSEFAEQLAGPSPDPRSLRFLIHLVADLHQPLHVADNGDQGGNCVRLKNGRDVADSNLHVFWDVDVVEDQAPPGATDGDETATAIAIALQIEKTITPERSAAWLQSAQGAPSRGPAGWPALWARESVEVAAAKAYAPIRPHGCDSLTLPPTYEGNAQAVAAEQLAKSGVRLAFLLNQIFDR
jgi:hypothetical protein